MDKKTFDWKSYLWVSDQDQKMFLYEMIKISLILSNSWKGKF